jgi:ubiquinone/menaquinone biosynthesis C-methylase UbiE
MEKECYSQYHAYESSMPKSRTKRDALFQLYSRAARILTPGLRYAQALYEDALWRSSADAERWLDLGCGHRLLPEWRLEQEQELAKRPRLLAGLDYDHGSLIRHSAIRNCVRGDISSLPFRDGAFDLVTSNMVFEHLKQPAAQLAEIIRVLKPGGILVFHTPNVQSYASFVTRLIPESLKASLIWFLQRRKEEDIFPVYYRINSSRRIKEVAQSAGFEVQMIRLIVSSAQLWMIPPLVMLELILIRLLMTGWGRRFRTNIIAVLRKPADGNGPALKPAAISAERHSPALPGLEPGLTR